VYKGSSEQTAKLTATIIRRLHGLDRRSHSRLSRSCRNMARPGCCRYNNVIMFTSRHFFWPAAWTHCWKWFRSHLGIFRSFINQICFWVLPRALYKYNLAWLAATNDERGYCVWLPHDELSQQLQDRLGWISVRSQASQHFKDDFWRILQNVIKIINFHARFTV